MTNSSTEREHRPHAGLAPPPRAEATAVTTTRPTQEPAPRDSDAVQLAAAWLWRTPQQAIRTMPVIAVVQELLNVLRDQDTPAVEALTTLRRAVRLLSVFVAEHTGGPSRDEHPEPGEHQWQPALHDIAASAESVRFATEWLRGTPHAAIRTTPVITIVEELLKVLLTGNAQAAYNALRRTVRLLNVLATEPDHAPSTHLAA